MRASKTARGRSLRYVRFLGTLRFRRQRPRPGSRSPNVGPAVRLHIWPSSVQVRVRYVLSMREFKLTCSVPALTFDWQAHMKLARTESRGASPRSQAGLKVDGQGTRSRYLCRRSDARYGMPRTRWALAAELSLFSDADSFSVARRMTAHDRVPVTRLLRSSQDTETAATPYGFLARLRSSCRDARHIPGV